LKTGQVMAVLGIDLNAKRRRAKTSGRNRVANL
jgi:hypothetical protein